MYKHAGYYIDPKEALSNNPKFLLGKFGRLDLCRSCDHWHRERANCSVYFVISGHNIDPEKWFCNCQKWAPKDNLKYLKWKYEKKEKVNGIL